MRIVPWVSNAVYGVVLLAGLYYPLAGLGAANPLRLLGFVAGMVSLFVLEAVERKVARSPVAFLAARLVLFVVVAAVDESGLSRALFVLVPFTAYLTVGRTVGLALGGLCLVSLTGGFAIWVPGWYRVATSVSDVLMFSMGLVLALAMAEVADRERRAAARIAELSAAAERTRLARDIHDSLGHHLTAISIQLEKAAAFADRDATVADQALADARDAVGNALTAVRTSVGTLRSVPVRLTDALTGLANDTGATLRVNGEEHDADQPTVTAIYRAAQEAITNARRHGQARKVTVMVTFGPDDIRLLVTDDGRGFDPNQPATGFGLLGLRERATSLGGTVTIDSEPGTGTRVAVTVPRTAILQA